RDYPDRHPKPEQIALVIEVADATLQRDRTLKMRLYASAGVMCYWILNLPDQQLEVYSERVQEGELYRYQQRQIFKPTEDVAVSIDGQVIAHLRVQHLLA
ncbi:MAG: Uma2 family endonuclease, partial [Betaproteobacteria bacterium]